MKKMLGILIVVLTATTLISAFVQAQETGATITGVITNIKEVKRHIPKAAYLQIIPLSPSGSTDGVIAKGGGIRFNSNLPKVPVPADGLFTIKVPVLKPGKYAVAIQNFQEIVLGGLSVAAGNKIQMVLKNPKEQAGDFRFVANLVKGKQYALFEVSKDAKLPLTFDLGEVQIYDHKRR